MTEADPQVETTRDPPSYTLEQLVRGVRPGELQQVFDWGDDLGQEVVEWEAPSTRA